MQPDPDAPLENNEILRRLAAIPGGWTLESDAIVRVYPTAGWKASLMLGNAIGFLCETAWHHPDMTLSWGRVRVSLSTHSAGGVTARDLELAERIEALVTWTPAGGALEGIPPGSSHAILEEPPATG